MQQALIAPTEAGYALADIKRAVLTYDRVFLLEPGDRDLFPSSAFGAAIGMPPIFSMPSGPIRPLGKTANYDEEFDRLITACKPLLDSGVLEVTSCWDRSQTDGGMTIGGVPLGGYQLNVQAILFYYRNLARQNDFLRAAVDESATRIAAVEDTLSIAMQGAADGSINNDPQLPEIVGMLHDENLRPVISTIARSRIAVALKVWGVAEQRGLVPVLPAASAKILDLLANTSRNAIDTTDPDPYWTRRTAILDVVVGEFLSDERLEELNPDQLLIYRTAAMQRAAEDRVRLFREIRTMAGEKTNLDLEAFRDRIGSRLAEYARTLANLNHERQTLNWQMKLSVGRAGAGALAAGMAGEGLFHVGLPFSLTTAALGAVAWGLGQAESFLPTIREQKKQERELVADTDFAVFRRFNYLAPMNTQQ